MKTVSRVAAFLTLLVLAGCAGYSAEFRKTTSFSAPAREADCAFDILTQPPRGTYQELGLIQFMSYDDVGKPVDPAAPPRERTVQTKPKAVAVTVDEMKENAQFAICRSGGNAVILPPPDAEGKFIQGAVIWIDRR